MPAIGVLYDFSNEQNKKHSLNIITTLAYEGVAFEMAQKVENEPVNLIVDGAVYGVDFINKHQTDILRQIRRIKKSQLEKVATT